MSNYYRSILADLRKREPSIDDVHGFGAKAERRLDDLTNLWQSAVASLAQLAAAEEEAERPTALEVEEVTEIRDPPYQPTPEDDAAEARLAAILADHGMRLT